MMIAAIYARKSTDQSGVADDQKSVTRQVEERPRVRNEEGLDREKEKARQRTTDAMDCKARAGQVTGGRVFGYDNIRIAKGHVDRRINETEGCCRSSNLPALRGGQRLPPHRTPPERPIPPAPGAGASFFSSGISATSASVVSRSDAMDAEF